jgi:hypothetical protein
LPRRTPTTTPEPITVAFAGAAEVSLAAIKGLMNDYLEFGPEDADGVPEDTKVPLRFIVPVTEQHLTDVMFDVLDYLAYIEYGYEVVITGKSKDESVVAVAKEALEVHIPTSSLDVNTTLISLLNQAEGRKVLILAFGDSDPSKDAQDLLELAIDSGIKVLDLTGGLDDLELEGGDDTVASDLPEAEPEPEPAPRGRARTPKAGTELVPVEVELTEDNLPTVEEAKTTAKAKQRAAIEARGEEVYVPEAVGSIEQDVHDNLSGAAGLGRYVVARLKGLEVEKAILLEYLALRTLSMVPESPAEDLEDSDPSPSTSPSRGRPRKDGSPAQARTEEPTTAYYKHENGTYVKRGRGKPLAGVEVVQLTEAEVVELGL